MLPLDAISLAAAIIQFVDFGSKLIIEGYGVYRSESGAPEDADELVFATTTLQDLALRLQIPRSVTKTKDELALHTLARACEDLAQELLDILTGLEVSPLSTGSLRTWKTVKKTIKRQVKAEKIANMRNKLDTMKKDINIHLLAVLRNDQSRLMHFLQEVAATSESMHFAKMNSIANLSAELKNALQTQTQTMSTSMSLSSQANDRLTLTVTRQEDALHEIEAKLTMLLQETTKITTSQKVFKTLVFKGIDSRAQQIHKEYPETFSRLFDRGRTPLPTWMQTGHGIYWVTGKAGSGKSTLMKFLAGHRDTARLLETWAAAGNRQLSTAAFYFWQSGSDMQTSQKGLLQSLLYQAFTQCPDMIKIATPPSRWEAARSGGLRSWRSEDLSEAFESLVRHSDSLAKCFCFFIDGLDEYHDDFGGYGQLLDTLDKLTRTAWIKLCVSSRPWNVFKSALGQDSQRTLVGHDFTRPDMDIFIKDMLEEDARFGVVVQKDPRAWHLAVEPRDRAQGVFLWVFLVVRRLLRLVGEMQHMERDTTFNALQHAPDEHPSDLDEYFKNMVDTIDEAHRMHTAGAFKLASHAAPLPLIAFWNLPMVMVRPESVLEAPIGDDDDGESDDELVRRTTETVNTWCKGLLEVPKLKADNAETVGEMDYQIDFLHRTVRDFLVESHEVQTMFSTHLTRDFDPNLTLLRLQISQIKILRTDMRSKHRLEPSLEPPEGASPWQNPTSVVAISWNQYYLLSSIELGVTIQLHGTLQMTEIFGNNHSRASLEQCACTWDGDLLLRFYDRWHKHILGARSRL